MATRIDLIETYARVHNKYVLYVWYPSCSALLDSGLESVLAYRMGRVGVGVFSDIFSEGFSVFDDSSECAEAFRAVESVAELAADETDLFAVTYGPNGGIDEL